MKNSKQKAQKTQDSQWLVLHRGRLMPFAELVALFGQMKAEVAR